MIGAIEVRLPRDRSCAGRARRWLEDHVPPDADPQAVEDLKLVATELVQNALVHGRGDIRLRFEARHPDVLRVEVTDQGRNAAIAIREQGAQAGGWGLLLVDRLSADWGAFEGTTHVWAEVRAHPA